MKIQIESTEKIVTINDVPARVWEGTTEGGVPVICFITRIAVSDKRPPEVHEIFKQELLQCKVPSVEVQSFPLRLIL
jgi:hypothetical protein